MTKTLTVSFDVVNGYFKNEDGTLTNSTITHTYSNINNDVAFQIIEPPLLEPGSIGNNFGKYTSGNWDNDLVFNFPIIEQEEDNEEIEDEEQEIIDIEYNYEYNLKYTYSSDNIIYTYNIKKLYKTENKEDIVENLNDNISLTLNTNDANIARNRIAESISYEKRTILNDIIYIYNDTKWDEDNNTLYINYKYSLIYNDYTIKDIAIYIPDTKTFNKDSGRLLEKITDGLSNLSAGISNNIITLNAPVISQKYGILYDVKETSAGSDESETITKKYKNLYSTESEAKKAIESEKSSLKYISYNIIPVNYIPNLYIITYDDDTNKNFESKDEFYFSYINELEKRIKSVRINYKEVLEEQKSYEIHHFIQNENLSYQDKPYKITAGKTTIGTVINTNDITFFLEDSKYKDYIIDISKANNDFNIIIGTKSDAIEVYNKYWAMPAKYENTKVNLYPSEINPTQNFKLQIDIKKNSIKGYTLDKNADVNIDGKSAKKLTTTTYTGKEWNTFFEPEYAKKIAEDNKNSDYSNDQLIYLKPVPYNDNKTILAYPQTITPLTIEAKGTNATASELKSKYNWKEYKRVGLDENGRLFTDGVQNKDTNFYTGVVSSFGGVNNFFGGQISIEDVPLIKFFTGDESESVYISGDNDIKPINIYGKELQLNSINNQSDYENSENFIRVHFNTKENESIKSNIEIKSNNYLYMNTGGYYHNITSGNNFKMNIGDNISIYTQSNGYNIKANSFDFISNGTSRLSAKNNAISLSIEKNNVKTSSIQLSTNIEELTSGNYSLNAENININGSGSYNLITNNAISINTVKDSLKTGITINSGKNATIVLNTPAQTLTIGNPEDGIIISGLTGLYVKDGYFKTTQGVFLPWTQGMESYQTIWAGSKNRITPNPKETGYGTVNIRDYLSINGSNVLSKDKLNALIDFVDNYLGTTKRICNNGWANETPTGIKNYATNQANNAARDKISSDTFWNHRHQSVDNWIYVPTNWSNVNTISGMASYISGYTGLNNQRTGRAVSG